MDVTGDPDCSLEYEIAPSNKFRISNLGLERENRDLCDMKNIGKIIESYEALPFINLNIKNVNFKTLIDSGAEVSLIQEERLELISNYTDDTIKITATNIVSANRKKMGQINRRICIEVTISEQKYIMQFYILKNLFYECILGIDNMRLLGIILNFDEGQVQIKDKIVNIEKSEDVKEINSYLEFKENLAQELNNVIIENKHGHFNQEENLEKDMFELPRNVDDTIEEVEQGVNIIRTREDIERLLISQELQEQEIRETLTDILADNMSLINDEVVFARDYEHKLTVDNDTPLPCKNYPIPFHFQAKVNDELKKLEEAGIIERSATYFINPVVLVRKKDESIRICIDARKLNQRIKPEHEMPQNIDVLLTKCGNKKWYSKLDLKNAFWLIKLDENSRKYCGFNVNGTTYQFTVCPFGVRTSPAGLIRFLHKILDIYEHFAIHYLDDIIIFSDDMPSHLRHIAIIIQTLNDNGMKLNLAKCQFCKEEVNYLGYVINQKNILLDPARLDDIQNFPRPTKLRQLRGFLGLLNYYRKFIPSYSQKTNTLLTLLRKEQKWKWTDEHENSFIELKRQFVHNLKLHHPNFELEFIVRTDASHNAIAAELIQLQNNEEIPIYFASRTLKPCEIRYGISEKEMLAIVFALTKLRYYLIGKRFTLETDHKALINIMNTRLNNNRIYRWALLIQQYDVVIKYKPGKEMVAADVLSRMNGESKTDPIAVNIVRLQRQGIFSLKYIHDIQQTSDFVDLKELLQTSSPYKGMYLKEGVIVKKIGETEVYVTNEAHTRQITNHIHQQYAHVGARKCWLIFREAYFCKNDEKVIKNSLRSCQTCELAKDKNFTNENIAQSIIAYDRLELVAIDFISNLIPSTKGYKNILVICDIFSKYVRLIPTQRCNTETVLQAIHEYCTEFGYPKTILSDHATYFTNDRYQEYLRERNIKACYISIRHPQANPSERYIREVLKYLRILLTNKHQRWARYLKQIEYTINQTPSTVHEVSPITIFTGQQPNRPWHAEDDIDMHQCYVKIRERLTTKKNKWEHKMQDKQTRFKSYQIGDQVIVKANRVTDRAKDIMGKLLRPYIGPLTIHKKLGLNTYELIETQTGMIKGRYHISMLHDHIAIEE